MSKYLYGASVQGIQSFIFQTNKLKEIIGASELVEEICTSMFAEQINKTYKELVVDKNAIVNAAGNIKYVFDDEGLCKKTFLEFPKKVMEAAPGITISQAVVEFDKEQFSEIVNILEKKLLAQRNKPMPSLTIGIMGMQRSRATGFPAVDKDNGNFYDEGAKKKLQAKERNALWDKSVASTLDYPNLTATDNINNITEKNDWIAIVHADGNGLGQVIRTIGNNNEKLHQFSLALDKATTAAAQEAAAITLNKTDTQGLKFYPFRPIVLGGDDLTIIIRGDLAIKYVEAFLNAFEKETKKRLANIDVRLCNGLTACAGIAFIKSSFPYYYGYNLAEDLCSAAKKDAKSRGNDVRSCIMFHKVQDSFVEDYNEIIERELTTSEGLSFKFGPYYLDNSDIDRWSIDDLVKSVKDLDDKEGNALKSGIRQWLTALLENGGEEKAKQDYSRLHEITSKKDIAERLTKKRSGGSEAVPAYDVLSLHSIESQQTK